MMGLERFRLSTQNLVRSFLRGWEHVTTIIYDNVHTLILAIIIICSFVIAVFIIITGFIMIQFHLRCWAFNTTSKILTVIIPLTGGLSTMFSLTVYIISVSLWGTISCNQWFVIILCNRFHVYIKLWAFITDGNPVSVVNIGTIYITDVVTTIILLIH